MRSFTTNLADGSGFLQVGISLSTYYDGRMVANVQRQMTPIRSAMLMVLAEQDPALISTSHGKQALQRQLTAAVNQVLRDKERSEEHTSELQSLMRNSYAVFC